MGSRVLGPKVDSVMSDFTVISLFPVLWGEVHMLGFIGVDRVAEALVDGDQAGTCLFSRLFRVSGIMAR